MAKNSQKSLKKCNSGESPLSEAPKISSRTSARKLMKKLSNAATSVSFQSIPSDDNAPLSTMSPEKVDQPCSVLNSNGKESAMDPETGTSSPSEAKQKEKNKNLLRYEIDMSEMAELRTINAVEFKSYLAKRFKNDGSINNLANNVTVEENGWNITVTSKMFFKKSALKFHAKKFLKMKKLRAFVQIVAKERMSYRFTYYKSQ